MSATHTSASQCQVLIVGAGPTGLVLAAQLLARGVRVPVIDKREGPARHRPGKDAPAVFALVRPDGVLAARGSRRDAHKVIDYLRQISAADAPEPADRAHLSGVAGSH
jgi:2-polyprenyl-6-methoxyphenol hydroxylase-like FAD-dependent oxidoreductase